MERIVAANTDRGDASNLTHLPPEIIHQILTHLECPALVSLIRTCQLLRKHADSELLWANLIRQNVPDPPQSPFPAPTFRALYTAHHPYWFLPKHRIWFSDNAHTGKLVLVKYDPRRGTIEGYRLLGSKGESKLQDWSYNPDVIIHSFKPTVTLLHDRPIIKLEHTNPTERTKRQGWWEGEVRMKIGSDANDSVFSTFFLSRAIPKQLQDPSMEMWPPKTVMAEDRVRSASQDNFQGWGHKPQKHEEISQKTFRLRTWMQFSVGGSAFGVRMGEEVSTWSTLDPALYVPTKEKPYQGIWVGDYAGHGCEFLLVTQRKTVHDESYQSQSRIWSRWLSDLPEYEPDTRVVMANTIHGGGTLQGDPMFEGRIEAIKLTGDVNVPRGEYSWIANDIGSAGFIRVAEEEPFQGARVVKSRGHLAARGFQNGLCFPTWDVSKQTLTHWNR
jgi:Cyclin D1 binding domain/F-box-like